MNFVLEKVWEQAKNAETPEETMRLLNVYMNTKEYISEMYDNDLIFNTCNENNYVLIAYFTYDHLVIKLFDKDRREIDSWSTLICGNEYERNWWRDYFNRFRGPIENAVENYNGFVNLCELVGTGANRLTYFVDGFCVDFTNVINSIEEKEISMTFTYKKRTYNLSIVPYGENDELAIILNNLDQDGREVAFDVERRGE